MLTIMTTKRRINKINKMRAESGLSILFVLNKIGMSVYEFLIYIGVNEEIVDSDYGKEIIDKIVPIISSPKAIISYNPSMESLSEDQIDIYDSVSKNSFSYMDIKASFLGDSSKEIDDKTYLRCNYDGYRIEDSELNKISFDYNCLFFTKDQRDRVITLKFPLIDMNIKASYEILGGKKYNYDVRIKDDMFLSDFFDCSNPLYNFNFVLSYAMFLRYKAVKKSISDDFYLKNMNKLGQRTSE